MESNLETLTLWLDIKKKGGQAGEIENPGTLTKLQS